MDEKHPALVAARNSWRCVQTHDKDGWLALMSDEICIEDPIGVSPTNPTGTGVRGKEAVAAFYDQNIGPNQLHIEAHESHVADRESAHVLSLTTTFPNGGKAKVRGIFTYRIDEADKLTNLRGYWTLDAMTFEEAP